MAIVFSIVLGLVIYLTTYSNRAPSLAVFSIFQVTSFAMSIVWVYMIANIIVDLLVLLGMLTGINVAILGLTVLSWGNSVGDAFASVSISKKGFGEMALTGCIAGPVFNLMLGLGLITVKCNLLLDGGIPFTYDDESGLLTFCIIIASILILSTMVWMTVSNKFKLVNRHANVLILLYAAVIILIGSIAFEF